ncbi:MAG: hypothetical protein IJD38_06735 [Clostridia bacterium]|nr:hypothetical protein [Clostridia bacterium]
MKTRYLRIMEASLSAYTDVHIRRYLDEVRENGLTEHGFPRLASNIGILIAHGIRTDLSGLFRDMMELCCTAIPRVKAANDFSVREVISCLAELEGAGLFPEDVARWKANLAAIIPENCYSCYATTPASGVRNWALFSAVSEYFRQDMGLCDSRDFIDLQIEVQLKWLDENGMYCDAAGYPHQPIMYDHVSRGLFALLLHRGYRGKHYAAMDDCLRRAGLATLRMQSVTGEMAFGGRSNQFIHNEGWLAALLEYEANRYAGEGNLPLATEFRSAALRAVESAEAWLSRRPIRHVKNRFPTETRYGCEAYAYFDKYMITAASNFYAAYLICDEGIPTVASPDVTATVWETSDRFHKLFLKAGGYGLEFDLNADPCYDANGLGRVQRAGAPSTLCLSQPCAQAPNYRVDIPTPVAMSLCPAFKAPEGWLFAAAPSALWRVRRTGTSPDIVFAILSCAFEDRTTILDYTVSSEGIVIIQKGKGIQHHAIPVLGFDGEHHTAVTVEGSVLTAAYEGWLCRYTVSGGITEIGTTAANRNGHYRVFVASGTETLEIRVELVPALQSE